MMVSQYPSQLKSHDEYGISNFGLISRFLAFESNDFFALGTRAEINFKYYFLDELANLD